MGVSCYNHVFGEKKHKHSWCKQEKLELWGKEWEITVAAKAYSGKPITDQQRESYQWFQAHCSELTGTITGLLTSYINDNYEELAVDWEGVRKINCTEDLLRSVTPRSLLIHQDGTVLLLLDCSWDEHGLATQLYPDAQAGSQDLFL